MARNTRATHAREITTLDLAAYPPALVTHAGTLAPLRLAREAWQGYLTQQAEPWGLLPSFEPTLRLHFDNRALPWARLQHHPVDGFDNNARNLGAHALLHAMFGAEKQDDPIEAGQIAYLLSCTDPSTGLAYSPDVLPRQSPLAQGELAQNVMLLYQQTGREELRRWAETMLTTLRRHAVLDEWAGVGPVAYYCQGGNGGQGGFIVGEAPRTQTDDYTLQGWQYLYVGWNLAAFSRWYEITGDRAALDLAVALANRLCHSIDAGGNDGALRPDGSFGGTDPRFGGSFQTHGHTHALPGLVRLGEQLIRTGERESGLALIHQARRTFDWLYDPARNPDAGSLTGWLPEFLEVAFGRGHLGDCEGCTMGDVVQTAAVLGAASRVDPSLADLAAYYDRLEQIFRNQLVEQVFRPHARYRTVLRDCLEKWVNKTMAGASPEDRTREVERRYAEALHAAERMTGQQMGLCGFADWVNQLPSDLDPELPGIHMQGCCADATIRAAHAAWSETVTGDAGEARINLAFNRVSPLADVISCLPHRGEVNVIVKAARRVLIRIPTWAPAAETRAYVDGKTIPVHWQQQYVVFDPVTAGQQLTVTYPLRLAEVRERINGVEYTELWRANTIVDIAPAGKWIPLFQRPELATEALPD